MDVCFFVVCIADKDYEFSVNPELITLVESNPFHGQETETVVAHLTKLNDIDTHFAHNEKIRYYSQIIYVLDKG